MSGDHVSAWEDAIVMRVSATLAKHYGIISRERALGGGQRAGACESNAADRCLMPAYDIWRDYDPVTRAARDCLGDMIEADTTFADRLRRRAHPSCSRSTSPG